MCVVSEVKNERRGNNYMQWAIAMLINMTLLSYGMQAGWVSPMTKVLQSDHSPVGHPMTDYEISWIASSFSMGAIFGVSLFSWIADKFGRKTGVLLIAIIQAIYWMAKCFAASTTALIILRTFVGVSAGACYNIVPMYVREISHDKIRGKLGSLFPLFQNSGLFIMYAMGPHLDYYVVLYVVTSISLVTTVLLFAIPETPAFLVKLEKFDQAATTLAKLRGLDIDDKLINNELDIMKDSESTFKSLPTISFISIFKNKPWRRGMILILSLVFTQSMSGNFAILTYTPLIMSSSGANIGPELQTMTIPVLMIIGSMISINIIERYGRKMLLAMTYFVAVMSMATLGTIMLIQQQGGSVPSWLPILSIAAYSCAYAAGISFMPYIVMSEIFKFQVRARIMGLLVTLAWCSSFGQLSLFTPMTKAFGIYFTFYFYAGVNTIGGLVTVLFLPETKGKSVEEIEKDLGGP